MKAIFSLTLLFTFFMCLPALAADTSTPVAKQESVAPASKPAAVCDGAMKQKRMRNHEDKFSDVAPEKREMLRERCKAYKEETTPLRKALMSKRAELDAQLYAKEPDDARIQILVKEISDLRAKMFAVRVNLKKKLIAEGILDGDMKLCYSNGKGHGKD